MAVPHFSDVPLKYLGPKECFLSPEPTLVSTVLGSCLAVTIFDPQRKVGGICHAFLPRAGQYRAMEDPGCMFVDKALTALLDRFCIIGSDCRRLEVKMFGGGQGIGANQSPDLKRVGPESLQFSVGPKNIQTAEEELAKRRMPIAARDVGGLLGRKVLFLTHTGGVWVKRLGKANTASPS